MLKKKEYWLTEFLSISRIIYKTKRQYENAILFTAHDGNDLSYFTSIPSINIRQSEILRICNKKPNTISTSRELETTFGVSVKTIRSDLLSIPNFSIDQTPIFY